MNIEEKIALAREKILASSRPYILYDDDPDGLASFLLIYRMVRAGKGSPLKGSPLDEEYAQKVNEYSPDLVIILDKAVVSQDFLDEVNAQIIWIDHHDVQSPREVLYINPQEENYNIPTSALCYQVAKQDAWIAAVGIIADWQLPSQEIITALEKDFPQLYDTTITNAPQALFDSTLGILARVFSFNLKGRSKDVSSSMKILTRITSPYELLNEEHAQAKLVMKKYKQHLKEYEQLYKESQEHIQEDVIIFTYSEQHTSFTPDLSNQLLYRYPQKAIFIARESSGSYKCSIRDNTRDIKKIVLEVIDEVGGDGGGHTNACGAIVPSELFIEFSRAFVEKLKRNAIK